jgi:hypothetical protein
MWRIRDLRFWGRASINLKFGKLLSFLDGVRMMRAIGPDFSVQVAMRVLWRLVCSHKIYRKSRSSQSCDNQ